MRNLPHRFLLAATLCLLIFPFSRASADTLYGHGNFDNTLYSIDIANQTVTKIGSSGQVRFGPEMQIAPDNSLIYMPNRVDVVNSEIFLIDPSTGATMGVSPVTYPGSLNVMVAMEYVDGTLFAALNQSGTNTDSTLATIDVTTGSMSVISVLTGVGNFGGMHYLNGTLYAISTGQGGTPAGLYTVDTTTGATTLIAAVTFDDGSAAVGMTSLAHCNGTMYAIVNNNTMLYSIDLATGVLTSEFSMGFSINSLTSAQSSGSVSVPVESYTVTAGTYASGGTAELASSDNSDLSVRRSSTDVSARVWVEVKGTSASATPTELSFTLESSVFARTAVNQFIDLYDYDAAAWEQVDLRVAARFSDGTTTIDAAGDLSRFVEDATGCMEARVRYVSLNPRQRFTANIDQMTWTIGN